MERVRSKGNLGKQNQIMSLKDIDNGFNLKQFYFFLDSILSLTVNIW